MSKSKLILALDLPSPQVAFQLLGGIPSITQVKIGPGLFMQEGPSLITELHAKGYKVFLDLKHHDIPNTVRLAVREAKEMGVWMLSVHCSGGVKMLQAAVEEAAGNPLLLGITVLTSLDDPQLREIGFPGPVEAQVEKLASLGQKAGLQGIVASPHEVRKLRACLGRDTLIITPGIRIEAGAKHDQSRTMTPREAVEAGADYLVIGRPILEASHPKEAVASILASLETAPKP